MTNDEFLIEAGSRALNLRNHERRAKAAQENLTCAYAAFKDRRGIDRIEEGTPEWDKMMRATRAQYAYLSDAKRQAFNAKRRLQTWLNKVSFQ